MSLYNLFCRVKSYSWSGLVRGILIAVSLLGGSVLHAYNWIDYLPLISFNQWVMTSEASDPLRVEVIGGPYFRTSFKDSGRDYRDQYTLAEDGLRWVNAYWVEPGGDILYVEFDFPGALLCPLNLTEGVAVSFSGSATGTLNPGASGVAVNCSFSGSVRFARVERILVTNSVLPVARIIISVQMTVDDGVNTVFTREISTDYAMLYGVGPVAVDNSCTSPSWSYNWNIGSLSSALPKYGNGYWESVPPDPRTGRKLTGIGLLDDSNFPWIYHYGEGDWLWVNLAASTGPFNLWMWSATEGTWVWASDLWGGWHFRVPSTWAQWP